MAEAVEAAEELGRAIRSGACRTRGFAEKKCGAPCLDRDAPGGVPDLVKRVILAFRLGNSREPQKGFTTVSAVVYLVGHGRVASSTGIGVPPNITMHWLAREGDVTGGLSNAFLSGKLTQEHSQSDPGTNINEHYLCSDMAWVTDTKIKDFLGRPSHPNGSPYPCVMYTQPLTDVPLSSIFKYLSELAPKNDWHLYWTCCRGYMEATNLYKTQWSKKNNRAERMRRLDPGETPKVGSKDIDGKHEVKDANHESVILAVKSAGRAFPPIFGSPTKAIHGIVLLE